MVTTAAVKRNKRGVKMMAQWTCSHRHFCVSTFIFFFCTERPSCSSTTYLQHAHLPWLTTGMKRIQEMASQSKEKKIMGWIGTTQLFLLWPWHWAGFFFFRMSTWSFFVMHSCNDIKMCNVFIASSLANSNLLKVILQFCSTVAGHIFHSCGKQDIGESRSWTFMPSKTVGIST